MSSQEVYADSARAGRSLNRRARLILLISVASVLLGAALFAVAYQQWRARQAATPPAPATITNESSAPSTETVSVWTIRGALTEACTCTVPCTCNFGEGPSPHSYCYPFYSYDIREGRYQDIKLNGLRFGSIDLRNNRAIFIDERADERQREALRLIAMRVIGHFSAEEAESKLKEFESRIRYVQIKQEYDDRRNHLEVAGIGEFSADYIMGLDKSRPVVVRNNTTWRIHDAIKAKTSVYRARVGRDVVDTKNTNSNQGEFEYTDKTDFGAPAAWNCGACASRNAAAESDKAGTAGCHPETMKSEQ